MANITIKDALTKTMQVTKDYIDTRTSSKAAYGTCSTEASVSEKEVVVEDTNWKLEVGSIVVVKYSVSNSATNATINVNGTGAYLVWYSGSEYTGSSTSVFGSAGMCITYMFNGTHWAWVSRGSYPSTTSNASLGHGYGVCSTAEATLAKACTISSYALSTGGSVSIKFTNAVPANSTLNIRTRGAKKIFYKGSAIKDGVIKAGDTATFVYDGTQYQLISIDRDETFSGNYNDLIDKPIIPSIEGLATEEYVDEKFNIQNFLMPDDFEGTDGEKLQACFDALKDTGGFISINREYVLDRDIVINQDSNLNLQTTVKGIAEIAKINCGPYSFKGKEGIKHSWGGIKFSDLQITGTETMMQCANLIRVVCSSCLISDFKYICYSPNYTQSMYFNECIIRNISESVMCAEATESLDYGNASNLFDTRICLCLIEWCNHLLTSQSYSCCIIDNNCIEGFTGIPFTFDGRTRGVVIKNNYFEANAGGAIDLSGLSNVYSQNITIDSNVFVTSDNADVTILLPINRVIGSCTISNNTASSYSTPLYIVPDSAKNYTGVYIYNNYGNTSGNTSIVDSNVTKLDYANSINNVIKGLVVDISDGAEARKLTNVRYFGKTTQDGTPSVSSPSVPVSLLNKQNIKTYISTTKNILEITATTATVNGITFEVTSAKQIRLSGTTTADDVIFNINYEQGKLNVPVGTWRMSGPSSSTMYIQLYVDGQLAGQTRNTEALVTVPEGATESYVRLKVNGKTGTTLSGYVSPMLVSSDDKDSSSAFEKFIKESFSLTLSTHSHGLHGVPVTSGGNYTDSTGQQWLADCIDVAKGTIDRIFKEITLDGTESWAVQTYSNQPTGMYCYRLALTGKRIGEGLSRCSHFPNVNKCWEFKQGCFTFSDHSGNRYSYFITDIATIEEWKSWLAANNVKFVYPITDIESVQLSESSLSQFSVVAVTKSHCRITNDKDCEMEVTYVVDTKSYIDNKTVTSTSISSIVKLTQAEYDALRTKDPNVLYIVEDAIATAAAATYDVYQTTGYYESDNDQVEVTEGNSYGTVITPEAHCSIENIRVTMDGVDITDSVVTLIEEDEE